MARDIRREVMISDSGDLLRHYLNRIDFSGAWFDTLGGWGDTDEVADAFTAEDLVAVSTLSVNVPGWAAIDLLDRRHAELSSLLAEIPTDIALHEACDEDLAAVFAVQDALDKVGGIGHVTRSKLLARKRPHLVPIRDQHVLQVLLGKRHGPLTRPLRDALQVAEDVRERLHQLRAYADCAHLSLLRVLDIVVWMRAHGKGSVIQT